MSISNALHPQLTIDGVASNEPMGQNNEHNTMNDLCQMAHARLQLVLRSGHACDPSLLELLHNCGIAMLAADEMRLRPAPTQVLPICNVIQLQ